MKKRKLGRPLKKPGDNRGGKREGAGRRPIYNETMTRRISFVVTNDQFVALEQLAEDSGSSMSSSVFCRALTLDTLREGGYL